jgi:predicted transcriptional regulator
MAKNALTRREREIMDILHRAGRASAQEVLDAMKHPPSYSAVRALLRLLEQRGHVKHVQQGQRYVYQPTASPNEARRSALAHVVRTFFQGSIEQTVTTLIDSSRSKLTAEELDRLAELVEKARREGR